MKGNRFIVIRATLSLVMSAAALAWQVKKEAPFVRSFRPLAASSITEAEFRILRAEAIMLRAGASPRLGIFPGGEVDISPDHKAVTVNVSVSRELLPGSYDERKKALLRSAQACRGSVMMEFHSPETELDAYEVRFVDNGELLKAAADSLKGNKPRRDVGLVAIYRNGELTMR